jgi:putative acetyltransferase
MPIRKKFHMIKIRRIELHEVAPAKLLIYRVAQRVFEDRRSLAESVAFFEAKGTLNDMDDIQRNYFDNDGIFLVMTDEEQIIGTGAIRKIDDETCELKRLWLLFEYHGKGLGYGMTQELFRFARQRGYQRIRLETDRDYQIRAIDFYKRIGFYEIPAYGDPDELALEMVL